MEGEKCVIEIRRWSSCAAYERHHVTNGMLAQRMDRPAPTDTLRVGAITIRVHDKKLRPYSYRRDIGTDKRH